MWIKTPLSSKFSDQLDRRKVFIKNLSDRLRIDSVRRELSKYGRVTFLDGLFDSDNRQFRNIAFAVFETETEAQHCLANCQQIRASKGFKVRAYKNSEDSSLQQLPAGECEQPSDAHPAEGWEKQDATSTRLDRVPCIEYLITTTSRNEDPLLLRDAHEDSRAAIISPDGLPESSQTSSLLSSARPLSVQAERLAEPEARFDATMPSGHSASLLLLQTRLWSSSSLGTSDISGQLPHRTQASSSRQVPGAEFAWTEVTENPQSGLINSPADTWNHPPLRSREIKVAFYTFPGGV
jgi:hypothetical protein